MKTIDIFLTTIIICIGSIGMFFLGLFIGRDINWNVDEPIIINSVDYIDDTYIYKTNKFNFESKLRYNVNDTIYIVIKHIIPDVDYSGYNANGDSDLGV